VSSTPRLRISTRSRRSESGNVKVVAANFTSKKASSSSSSPSSGKKQQQQQQHTQKGEAVKFSSSSKGRRGGSDVESKSTSPSKDQPHLYFDEAVIIVSGGKGGDGETFKKAKPKVVKNSKFKRGTQQAKFIELPSAEPADGGIGGSIYIVCDRFTDSLLHLHERKEWRAKRGYHGGAAEYAKPGRERHRVAPEMDPLCIKVPPGTVIRKKRSGELIADLTQPGERVLIARGGNGGLAARRAEKVAGSESMGLGGRKKERRIRG